jgi:hypothetical protein
LLKCHCVAPLLCLGKFPKIEGHSTHPGAFFFVYPLFFPLVSFFFGFVPTQKSFAFFESK